MILIQDDLGHFYFIFLLWRILLTGSLLRNAYWLIHHIIYGTSRSLSLLFFDMIKWAVVVITLLNLACLLNFDNFLLIVDQTDMCHTILLLLHVWLLTKLFSRLHSDFMIILQHHWFLIYHCIHCSIIIYYSFAVILLDQY
jgi:hypothetical protein